MCCGKAFKGSLSGLRQFLTTGSPLKMMKNAFYFMLKARSILKVFTFCRDFLLLRQNGSMKKLRLMSKFMLS